MLRDKRIKFKSKLSFLSLLSPHSATWSFLDSEIPSLKIPQSLRTSHQIRPKKSLRLVILPFPFHFQNNHKVYQWTRFPTKLRHLLEIRTGFLNHSSRPNLRQSSRMRPQSSVKERQNLALKAAYASKGRSVLTRPPAKNIADNWLVPPVSPVPLGASVHQASNFALTQKYARKNAASKQERWQRDARLDASAATTRQDALTQALAQNLVASELGKLAVKRVRSLTVNTLTSPCMPWVCVITATTNMVGAGRAPIAPMPANDSSTLKVSAKTATLTTTTSSKGGRRKL